MSKSKPTNAELTALVADLKQQLTEGFGVAHTNAADPEMGIVERLIAIGREIGPMAKADMKNVNYNAFAVDDVYSKLRPLFSKWGVVVVPTMRRPEYIVTERDGGNKSPAIDAHVWIDYHFYSPDQTHVTMTFAAEGRDFGDKATNKAVQQAFKYGLIQMFMISTGEVDPDNETGEIEGHSSTAEATPYNDSSTTTRASDIKAGVENAEADLRMKQVKDHAWLLTAHLDGDDDLRIRESKLLIEQELEAYGRSPKDATDAQAIMANMDATMAAAS